MEHRRTLLFAVFLLSGLALTTGCLPEEADRCVTLGSEIAVTASPNGTVDGAVTIAGTVSSACTVRRVEVGTWQATPDTANFATWSVEIELNELRAAAERAGGDPADTYFELSLPVTATLFDESALVLSSPLALELQLRPKIRVEGLELEVVYPEAQDGSDLCTLPSDGSHPGWIEITALGRSAGGAVRLSTTAGTFVGFEEQTIELELGERAPAGDDDDDPGSFAGARLIASDAGTAFLVATAEGEAREEVARFTGPPTFVPPGSKSLTRGETFQILVRSTGTLSSCIVLQESGDVSSARIVAAADEGDGLPVLGTSVALDAPPEDCESYTSTEDHLVAITFDAASSPGAVTLVCADQHGVETLGTYRLAPPG